MPDGTSAGAGSSRLQSQRPEAPPEVDSRSAGHGGAVLIPLRPAGTRKARRPSRARTLSPLWAEVASVLARAQPVVPDAVSSSSERRPDDPDRKAA